MALYLGTSNKGHLMSSDGYRLQDSNGLYLTALSTTTGKLKIILNGVVYRLNVKLPAKESE